MNEQTLSPQDQRKQEAAQAAADYVATRIDNKSIVGVGTGSTTNFFIDALAKLASKFDACVASSLASAERLEGHGLRVLDLNAVDGASIVAMVVHGVMQHGPVVPHD